MPAMFRRLLTAATLASSAFIITACGGGGGGGAQSATLEIVKTGAGSGVVSGVAINCGTSCRASTTVGVTVSLTATPDAGQQFDGWSGDAAACRTNTTCSFVVQNPRTIAGAAFSVTPPQPVNRSLLVSKTGNGSVTSSPAGISCGDDCSNDYQQGTMVNLNAVAGSGFTFLGWSGACSGTASCTVTMDTDKTVAATFATSSVTLTISKNGSGMGTVSSSPAGISCGSACSANFPRGSSVSLSAVAGGNDTFQGWNGGGCSGVAACTVTLNADTTVSASFTTTTTLGEFFGLTSANRIVSFDRATPGTFKTSALITGLNAGETVTAIDTRPLDNKLYGLTSSARLVTIDAVSGAATLKSTLVADSGDTTNRYSGITGNPGMDFNPVADRLRIVTSTGQNLRVNADSGAVITDANVTAGSAVTDPAYTFNYNGSSATTLFVIDSASDRLRVQTVNAGQTNDGTLTDVGNLGVDVAVDGGFEIIGTNVDAFAALKASADPATGALYQIDLRTGAATKIANFGGSDALIGLAAPVSAAPPATGDLAVLTSGGKVLTVNRTAANTLATSAFITGLPAGETPFDLDYRPRTASTGELIVLTRDGSGTGRLYRVDPATGAAFNPSTGAAGTGVTVGGTTPVALTGSSIGIDFNPVTGLLRIITSDDQNLTVNADTGAVTSDTSINPAASSVVAAAYTNGFTQTAGTTLYAIDAAGRTLNTQAATGGAQVVVGSLNLPNLVAPVGFDINARNNEGLLSVNESGAPKLYSVKLTTGETSGAVTLPGGETVKGVSLKTPKEPEVYGLTGATSTNLIRFTTTTSTAYTSKGTIAPIGNGMTVLGIDFRPQTGQLIALASDGSAAKLYVVNPDTAAATELSTLAPDINDTTAPFTTLPLSATYAVDFNPAADRLRVVSSSNKNLRINVDTGAVITDEDVGRPPVAITGNAYTNSGTPLLYGVDSASGRLFSINATTGALTAVGPLGTNVATLNGFDIIGTGTAYFAGKDATDNLPKLYELSLSSGSSSPAKQIGTSSSLPAGTDVLALAARTQGNNDVFAVVSGGAFGSLVSFDKTAPSTLFSNPRALSGIGSGERVIGMDFAAITSGTTTTTTTDTLYLVTAGGSPTVAKVYTVDFTTAMATAVPRGQTCTGTAPAPLALVGTNFDVEYVPNSQTTGLQATNGLVRINSDGKQNATIDLTCLTSSAGTDLQQPAPVVTSEAYTNSFAGASSTKLYALDTTNDFLMTQGGSLGPNDGQLFDVRALTTTGGAAVNVDAFGGFDILGGADGYVVGVLKQNANAYSTAYRINLNDSTQPVLTSLGDVGRPTPTPDTRVQVNAAAVRFMP